MFWDYILTDYIFDYIFMGFAFIIYYIFVILYLDIQDYSTCFVCFIDLSRAGLCSLHHDNTNDAKKTNFTLLHAL